jgi:dihydrolipoyl dehydrogenase
MYDVIILGGGPGGYRAAELAGKEGLKTVIIEKDYLGGMCLNRGCIPTKAYYSDVIGKNAPVEDMWNKKEEVVKTLRDGIAQLMELTNVDVKVGYGVIKEANKDIKKVEVKTSQGIEIIEGKKLIIAVGSKAMDIKFENNNLDGIIWGDFAVNDEELWNSDKVKSVVIAGAGVIAIEFAFMLKEMGKEVTILKHSDQILRRCDIDIKKKLKSLIKRKKIKTLDYFKINKVSKEENTLTIHGTCKKGDKEIQCDRLILASSMTPIVNGYGLENTNIEYDNKGIKVDKHLRTNIPGVYAIGDVTGGMMLAHVAEYEAMSVVSDLINKDYTVDYNSVPYCIFAEPEIAAVGITEQEAEEKGISYKVGRSHFISNGMALAMGKTTGFVKVIADENNKIFGVHMLGPEASAMIGEAALAIYAGLTVEQVAKCVHPHPTLTECFKDALFNLMN